MFHTVGFALTAKSSDSSNIGSNMSNFSSIGEIGRVAIPPLAIFITSLIGWRMAIGILGGGGLLLFFILQLLIPQKASQQSASEDTPQHHRDFVKDIITIFKQKPARSVTIAAYY